LAQLAAIGVLWLALRERRRARRWRLVVPALALPPLALLSTLWSPDAALTLRRSLTLVTLFVVGVAATALASRRECAEIIVVGILAGVAAIAVWGFVELVRAYDDAVVPATTTQGARYQGIGQNPNTMAMLFAIALPLAAWAAAVAPTRPKRVLALVLAALLVGSIAASGSRGATVGAAAGIAVVVVVTARRRLLAVCAVVAATVVALLAMQIPDPAETDPLLHPEFGRPTPASPLDVSAQLPLENEFGFRGPNAPVVRRTLFSSGGRIAAWRGGFDQYRERPLAGYGFGTEELVFVDRYNYFLSERIENSYIATLLQLGPFGLVLLVVALALPLARWVRSSPRSGGAVAAACAGATVAGVVVAVTQSFITSVGSPATLPFWLCVFALAGAAQRPRSDERERTQREEDASNGHRESRLDVVRPEQERVRD